MSHWLPADAKAERDKAVHQQPHVLLFICDVAQLLVELEEKALLL